MSYYGTDPPVAGQGAGRPASRGSTALLAALVVVFTAVLCGGGVGALYLIGAKTTTGVGGSPSASATGTGQVSSSATPSFDPSSITKGQCVVNESTDQDHPRLRVVACGPKTLKVLVRIDGTVDTSRCNAIAGSTHHYYYDTTPDNLDFVLCFRQQ
jgi:hypothetical protein